MIVNIAIIGRTYEGTNERTPNECASKRDRNEERTPARVPRGTIHKEEEGKSVCLSGIMTTTMAGLDPFLTDLFMKEGERDPFEYLLPDGRRGRVSWRKDRSLTERYARALTQSPAPP